MSSALRRHLPTALSFLLLAFLAAHGQEARRTAFRAVNYEVSASLVPSEQRLVGRAKVDLEAKATSRQVDVELHPGLRIRSVTTAQGQPVEMTQDENTPARIQLLLPQSVEAGQITTLIFEYDGRLTGEENSPVKGVQLAHVGQGTSYLLQASRWFPLTDFPSNRYTATFKIDVPEGLSIVGTGRASAPQAYTPPVQSQPAAQPPAPAPAKRGRREPPPVVPTTPAPTPPPVATIPPGPRVQYTFRSETPEIAGTFVIGDLRVAPVRAEGLEVGVYVSPAAVADAAGYGEALAKAVVYFSSEFGPTARRSWGIVQIPDGSVQGYYAPGLVLISQRQWDPRVNSRLLARLVAQQWWGHDVIPASASDAWLSDGLARYSEAMVVESTAGEEGFRRALEDFAVGALMFEDAAPIAQAQRLELYSSEYRSVVVNKGALVAHMLRSFVGDAAFRGILRAFHSEFSGKTAALTDFQNLAQQKVSTAAAGQAGISLTPFFAQWLNSTGVPEFQTEYVVFRTQKGFRIDGKVKQNLDTFRLPVEMKIETEGNPEIKVVDVVGSESTFSVETFGRPRPGGVTLDPNNRLLKSSAKLRVRAIIARGEELAELGRFYDAIQEYQRALDVQSNNSLAHFRTGEAMFYQKNLQAAANAFREAQVGDLDPSYKWVVVWGHLYLGKIFDMTGQRERALNEYQKAVETNDDTGGAQAEAQKYIQAPYSDEPRKSGP